MSLVHTHQWLEVSRDFTPGLTITKVHGMEPEAILKLVAGQTHVYLKCLTCGDITHRDLTGNFSNPTVGAKMTALDQSNEGQE